ncbi:MAG: hypothetical protein AAGI63_19105, partial [Planctomycetota bacterium]
PPTSGWMFSPLNDRGWRITSPTELGRFIKKFGKKAGVVVIPEMDGKPKQYATAQHLRQGFGHRWATKVSPVTLQHLMRHADFKTTQQFYANVNADLAASDLERRVAQVETHREEAAL